ncbi:MAG: response regulator transcription factor [Bacteroidota bacterium]
MEQTNPRIYAIHPHPNASVICLVTDHMASTERSWSLPKTTSLAVDHQRAHDLQQLTDHELDVLSTVYAAFVVEWSESNAALFLRLKQMTSKHRPPIFAVCGSECIDHIAAMVIGADYILQKPPNPLIVHAALRASQRRVKGNAGASKVSDSTLKTRSSGAASKNVLPSVRLDERRRQFFVGRIPIELTQREFDLMALFMGHPDECLSRDSLLEALWGLEYDGSTNVVDVTVCNIRKKLALHRLDSALQTVRGVGYRFIIEEPSALAGIRPNA